MPEQFGCVNVQRSRRCLSKTEAKPSKPSLRLTLVQRGPSASNSNYVRSAMVGLVTEEPL